MTADLVESARAEVSTAHSVTGTAKRATQASLSDCGKLEAAAKATLGAVTTWSTQVTVVALPSPAEPEDMTAGIENVRLTGTFGGGWLEGWATQAHDARDALAGAREAAEKLRSWAEPAGKAYNSAVLHLRGLAEWLELLHTNLGQVLHGVEGAKGLDATQAAEYLSSVASWLQDQAGFAGEAHGAFEQHHGDLAAATRNLPASYASLLLASKAVPTTLQMAARKLGGIVGRLEEQTSR